MKKNKLRRPVIKKKVRLSPAEYRNGGEGCIRWIEDYCYAPIYPEGYDIAEWTSMAKLPDTINEKTGRSYKYMWEEQKGILREALKMENGRFIYSLIVFCWMRGEGKSFILCLILLWKFFNWPRQMITLGANSRDQVKFVHFDIIADVIKNSPNLYALIAGTRNIQEKEIILRDSKGNKKSTIRSISSFSGIVSNITGYSFSEIFDMKNPKFFVQLDGSIRNMPNSFGMIDSTVSSKTHILYDLYQNSITGKTKKVYFSYRFSDKGDPKDYWNPNMDGDQLEDYRAKFPFDDFERYFLNRWDAGSQGTFSKKMIEEIGIIGSDGHLLNHDNIVKILDKKHRLIEVVDQLSKKSLASEQAENIIRINRMDDQLIPVEKYYSLKDKQGFNISMELSRLIEIGDVFDTHFSILSGGDFGDPYALRGLARTILVFVAKGLVGSRSTPYMSLISGAGGTPKYIYILMAIVDIQDHSLDVAKTLLEELHEEYGGIDTFCSERYGAWDMSKWCEERDITFEPVYPNYGRQKEALKEVFMSVKEGRFKAPQLAVPGTKKEDVLREEMSVFMHVDEGSKKWFGSPEKMEKYGIQDDSIFALAWCMYGGRMLNPDDFRVRKGNKMFGLYLPGKGLIGDYR